MHVAGSLFFDSKYTSPKAIPRASSDHLESTTTDILHPSQGPQKSKIDQIKIRGAREVSYSHFLTLCLLCSDGGDVLSLS